MNERERTIARARLLRRDGNTYAEIRAALGPLRDRDLESWLRGIPRPARSRRMRARDSLRRECRRLRAQGLTYGEIAARTGASKGSISLWVSEVGLSAESRDALRRRQGAARREVGDALRRRAKDRRDDARRAATAAIGDVAARDLFVAGLALYWAEGGKDKPWRHDGRVVFINSDVNVIALFLSWLDLVGVSEERRCYRLSIHESCDTVDHEAWWAQQLAVPLASFAAPTLKRHRPRTVRHNVGDDYHGCLTVSVTESWHLYYAIEGWWAGLTRDVRRREGALMTDWTDNPPWGNWQSRRPLKP